MATRREARTCHNCGEATQWFSRGCCQACYTKLFVPTSCSQCGRTVRALSTDTNPVCTFCVRAAKFVGKQCARCHRELKPHRRTLLADGRASCKTCLKYFQPPKTCAYCGKVSFNVQRSHPRGFDELACSRCRGKCNLLCNCAGCRRPRLIAGTRDDGKQYCKDCLPTGHPPLITCVACGQTKYAYSKTHCEDCGWERSHQRLIRELMPQLHQPWTRTLFERYHQESRIYSLRGNWLKSLRKDIGFFVALESAFDGMEALSGVLIIRRLGWPAVREHQRVMSFLAQQRLVLLDEDPDYWLEIHLERIRRLVSPDEGWISDLVGRFLQRLLLVRSKVFDRRRHARVPVSPRTIEGDVRVAHKLLLFARDRMNAGSVQELTQDTLDLYVSEHKGETIRLRSFIRYLNKNEKLFHRLKLRETRVEPPFHLALPDEQRLALIDRLLAVSGVTELRWGLLALLATVYVQRPNRACAMRLDQIRETESGGHQMRFAKVWLDVDPKIDAVLTRWLTCRREYSGLEATDESPFLFPGRRATTHMQSRSLARFRRLFGFEVRRVYASGLKAIVCAGIRQPRVLMDCFGVSASLALQYCEMYGAYLGPRAKHVLQHHA